MHINLRRECNIENKAGTLLQYFTEKYRMV